MWSTNKLIWGVLALLNTVGTTVGTLHNTTISTPGVQAISSDVIFIISCCMWCLEKCIKFLNKHASYILTAI